MISYPIADLHCDLLDYLCRGKNRSITDPCSRCSLPQLQEGHVVFQVFAIFAETGTSSLFFGEKQKKIFLQQKAFFEEKNIFPVPAIENGSVFCDEKEPLEEGFSRLERFLKDLHQELFYIGMTWNGENRFGGGIGSEKGLKEDGKRLLEYLEEKKIPLDLSHASQRLCEEIFSYIEKKSLKRIRVLASHCNVRKLCPHPRNLSEDILKEVIRRKGLIGINFYPPFIGRDFRKIFEHIFHVLNLQGEDAICFGGDFFYDEEGAFPSRKPFFEEASNSSCYPFLLSELKKEKVSEEILCKMAFQNVFSFLQKDVSMISNPGQIIQKMQKDWE